MDPLGREATVGDGIAVGSQFVGVDLHLRRSVIARIDERGREVDCVRIDNDRTALVREVAKAGEGAPVAIEATYGWYWAVDALRDAGFDVHLAHPYGMRKQRRGPKRAKTDRTDAFELARLLRLESLPEAWIAPPEIRELRELVPHRRALTKVAAATSRNPGRRGQARHPSRRDSAEFGCRQRRARRAEAAWVLR